MQKKRAEEMEMTPVRKTNKKEVGFGCMKKGKGRKVYFEDIRGQMTKPPIPPSLFFVIFLNCFAKRTVGWLGSPPRTL